MATATDTIRCDQSALLVALREAGADVSKPKAMRCPFHDDQHPSSGVYADDVGVWRFKCQTCGVGGDVFDIRAMVEGRPVEDLLKESSGNTAASAQPPPPVYESVEEIQQTFAKVREVYRYTNPATREPDMVVFRCQEPDGRKSFIQCRPERGGYVMKAPPKPWPIYNRTRIAQTKDVVVVEGEKDVHSLHLGGIVATTSPGGAGKAEHADWSPLAGKTVYLWPDNDAPNDKGERTGIAHMRQVARILDELDPPVRVLWIDPDTLNLPAKGDATDYIDGLPDQSARSIGLAVRAVMQDAEPVGASSEVTALVSDTISGKRRAIGWPWRLVGELTKALLPATVTLLCGDPGATKSFLMLEAAAYWHNQGESVALMELEENRVFHLYRALAQRVQQSAILDDDWVREHADEVTWFVENHQEWLDTFGRCLHVNDNDAVKLSDVAAWVERMARAGKRIIAVDPITAVATGPSPWIDALEFLTSVKHTITTYECSLVLVTHPRKGRDGGTLLDDVAGGAAYTRFTQTVLWLEHHEPPKSRMVGTGGGCEPMHSNRTLHICKARNARGQGRQLAFRLDGGSLKFQELGMIVTEDELNG
jgi:hypothetical protein